MGELKIKIKQGQTEIELEGEGEVVLKIFNELKNDGLGKVKHLDTSVIEAGEQTKPVKLDTEVSDENFENINNEVQSQDKLPTINSLALKLTMSSEKLWTLLYCLYENEEGNMAITSKDVLEKYKESNRYKTTISKNLSSHLKTLVKEGYLDAVSKSEFRITKKGIDFSVELINNNGKIKKKGSKVSRKKTTTLHDYQLIELNINPTQKESLQDFWDSHKHKSAQDKVTLIGYWLEKNNIVSHFGESEVFTVLKILKESTNFDIAAALRNSKTFKKYLKDSEEKGCYKVTHIVDEYVLDQETD